MNIGQFAKDQIKMINYSKAIADIDFRQFFENIELIKSKNKEVPKNIENIELLAKVLFDVKMEFHNFSRASVAARISKPLDIIK